MTKFGFLDLKMKWIFWGGSWTPHGPKLAQKLRNDMKQNQWKFEVDRTIFWVPRTEKPKFTYIPFSPEYLKFLMFCLKKALGTNSLSKGSSLM